MNWPPTKEELHDLYWNQELSLGQIADKVEMHHSSILRWMKIFNIPRRKTGHHIPRVDWPNKDTLQKWYWEDDMTSEEIAMKLKCTPVAVRRRFQKVGIKVKVRPERKGTRPYVFPDPIPYEERMEQLNIGGRRERLMEFTANVMEGMG